MTILEGDSSKPEPFAIRLQIPAGTQIAAHWHPGLEHVTVISGTFHIGLGDKLDTMKGITLPPGSFMVLPPKTNHYAWAEEDCVIQLHGVSPWGLHYVNPAEDPSNTKS